MPELWEKQKGESRQAFQAFAVYRDMGPARSHAKVAQQLGKTKSLMDQWSRKWFWQRRVAAWDEELDRQAREKQIKEVQEMNERHIAMAKSFQRKAAEKLLKINIDELSPSDTVKFFEIATKVERLARGEPTENQEMKGKVEHNHTGKVAQEHDLPDAIKNNPKLQELAIALFRARNTEADQTGTADNLGDNSSE